MKFTLSWLRDHLEFDLPVAELGERLTMLGLEIEEISDRAADFAAFTVGHVTRCEPHPDADRLRVCVVDTGAGEVQVVCGAPNAHKGMKGVFAPSGTTLPGTGLELKKAKIRGVESNGMLCSEREMGLSDEHEGIIELPEDAEIGAPFAEIMGLGDPVIEIAITPNRQECLGVHGIARDLAAAGVGTLLPFDATQVAGGFQSPVKWCREFSAETEDACPMVVGRYFRNVRNGPSPGWVRERLTAIGLRPISALVDITNLVTFDLGRPLHVFDADKIEGDLTMRLAREGEKILALDGKEYTLDPTMTVIADENGVHGIGGVMGGEESGCTEDTTNVFLEVALFDTIRTAATGRKLGIDSDARYRFERGVDPESALWGAEVAARLVTEFCGGEASEPVIAGAMPDWAREVRLRLSRVRDLCGVDVDPDESMRILEALGFTVAHGDGKPPVEVKIGVPSWRADIVGEADLVEEIVRVHGYDKVPVTPLTLDGALPHPALSPAQRRVRQASRALAARGMFEAVTWSFVSGARARLFGGGDGRLQLANPISADLDVMRPSILPNLIDAAGRNADRGTPDIALYEVGPQYSDDTPEGQALVAAGLRAGGALPRHWSGAAREADAFDAKADALAALEAAGAPVDKLQITSDAPAWYHPGRSGTLRLGPKVLAWFGEIHPGVLRRLDVKGTMAGFELFLDNVPQPKSKGGKMRPLLKPSPFQPVERDFAFVVDTDVPADKLVRAARGADKSLIVGASIFDIYEGAGIGEGKKSLAIAVTLQPAEKTLTDAEIDEVANKIVANVEKQTGGVLRG